MAQSNNCVNDNQVSFMVDQLAWFTDELNFPMKNIPKIIDFFEDESVTLIQFNQLKRIQHAFEEKINQLNSMNQNLKQLISETEPYREPLKAV